MQSLLPNIIEVAERNGLIANPKTLKQKEVRYKCPFCNADANKSNKFFLSINEEKNVFKCWYCKEAGGVLKFVSLLEGKSEQDLIEEIRLKSGSTYKKHPAERLTKSQLKLIGYLNVDWVKNREFDYQLYRSFREKVWTEWKNYTRERRQFAYQMLVVGLCSGTLKESVESAKKIEKQIGENFLDQLLKLLFKESKGENVFQVEKRACEMAGLSHPFETYLEDKTIKNEDSKGENFKMINKCIFVGRLSSDVELRYTPNGKAVANFGLALTRAVPDQNGDRQADFIRCQAWGKVAENMANQLSKGDMIAIESRVQTRSYQGQDGKTNYVTEFIVEGFPQFLKVKKWVNGNSNQQSQVAQTGGQQVQYQAQAGGVAAGQYQNQAAQSNPFDYGQPVDLKDDDLLF